MLSIARKILDRIRLWLLLREQSTSVALRDFFRSRHDIDVGLHSYGCFDRWRMPGPLRIGRYCSIAKTVRVVDANHPFDALTTHPILYEVSFGVVPADRVSATPLVIGDDVWIGHNAVILPGCKHIGRGAVIGAGAIVTHDIEPYSIVAGVPARPLRRRFGDEMIAAIERSRWWEREPAELKRIYQRFPEALDKPDIANLAEAFRR